MQAKKEGKLEKKTAVDQKWRGRQTSRGKEGTWFRRSGAQFDREPGERTAE